MYRLTLKEYKDLFNRKYPPLCLLANKYLKNIEVSKDIVQDVFIKIWENKIQFQNKHTTTSYLYTAVKNRSLDYLKNKRNRTTDYLSNLEIEKMKSETYFLREVVVVETATIIEEAINTLPNRCAQVIRLSIKEFTNLQIAEQLNVSINTVKAQKKIAYKKLRPLLKNHFIFIAFVSD
jgi:RNA polymerase sigma-70 factor (ECF subfamily)